ncbi:MAG: ComEA family DNA-binding protein [Flavobacteriaceae bacterium]
MNTADVKSLQIISGIGPKLSKRITSYRTLLKGFSTLDQC